MPAYAFAYTPDGDLPESRKDTTTWSFADIAGHPDIDSHIPVRSSFANRFIHRIGVEARPEHILPTNPFLGYYNKNWAPIRNSFSTHLKYSFQFHPGTAMDRVYGRPYQGIGLGYYAMEDSEELGRPLALYLFQGARIAQILPRLSFNYEWNFGLSAGWKPYDYYENPNNKAIGSRMNAYINMNLYLNWALSYRFDLTTGVGFTHFSNGNTKYPMRA